MKDIVVGVDGSPGAEAALRWALDEARTRGLGLRAVMACGRGRPGALDDLAVSDHADDLEQAGHGLLQQIVDRQARAHPTVPVTVQAVFGEPATVLTTEAATGLMLVVGARGLGPVRRLLLGSVSNACLHDTPVPIVVVRHHDPVDPTLPVVVGVDSSTASEDALRRAAEEARLRRVPLHVVHAWQGVVPGLLAYYPVADDGIAEAARAELDNTIERCLPEPNGLDITTAAPPGPTAITLMDQARKGQLLVVGSRGRGGFAELVLGSTSHQCATHADVPVMVVPFIREPVDS